MSSDSDPMDWGTLDPWWSIYIKVTTVAEDSTSIRTLHSKKRSDWWSNIDSLWETNPILPSHSHGSTASPKPIKKKQTALWEDLDPWWDTYTDTGHDTVVAIADLLKESNNVWERSEAPFDADPLASRLTRDQLPLLPSDEQEWSDWLARLLQPSAALVSEVFDVPVDESPSNVEREDQISKDQGSFRRPDILIFQATRGISVEVKLGDEHYEKTAETATLIETEYSDQEWIHTLLLPSAKMERLESRINPDIQYHADGSQQIMWDDPESVSVIHWRDVCTAVRTVLREGEAINNHWSASAYLFCAAIEQQILSYQPKPTIDRLADPVTPVDQFQAIAVADKLEEQLTYLNTMAEL